MLAVMPPRLMPEKNLWPKPGLRPRHLRSGGGRPKEKCVRHLRPHAWSSKRNSKGHQETWIGYKLHLDTIDGDIPVSVILTSAAIHDSQVAIPLAQMTAERVTSLDDLMDSAYDAPSSNEFSRGLGHVPIIDPNPRRGALLPLAPAEQLRFRERSAAE